MKLNLMNGIGGIDATLSGLMTFAGVTQGSSQARNPGLNDSIPLGLRI